MAGTCWNGIVNRCPCRLLRMVRFYHLSSKLLGRVCTGVHEAWMHLRLLELLLCFIGHMLNLKLKRGTCISLAQIIHTFLHWIGCCMSYKSTKILHQQCEMLYSWKERTTHFRLWNTPRPGQVSMRWLLICHYHRFDFGVYCHFEKIICFVHKRINVMIHLETE